MAIPKTLLIVDDEPDIREIVRDAVSDSVERFFEAGDGVEALKHLGSNKIHAIITDFKMPVMDGITLLKQIRELKHEIPCIMLTGNASVQPDLRDNAFKWGVVQFLEKPIDLDLLANVVSKTLEIGQKLANINEDLELLCKQQNIAKEARSSFKRRERPLLVESLMREAMGAPALKKTGS